MGTTLEENRALVRRFHLGKMLNTTVKYPSLNLANVGQSTNEIPTNASTGLLPSVAAGEARR